MCVYVCMYDVQTGNGQNFTEERKKVFNTVKYPKVLNC